MKAFLVFLLLSLLGLSRQQDWSYNYESQWSGVCRIGQQQSPINIMTRDAVTGYDHIRGPLVFRGYDSVKVQGENNGRALQWNENGGDLPPVLSGGPLVGNYTFLQFHLHWLSEHAIDGLKYPLEIHIVHVKTGFTFEEAIQRADGLAVIGIFGLVHNSGDERGLDQIMPDIPYLFDESQNKAQPFDLNLSKMLSPNPESYYTYHGSLTTPQCQESVTWIVMDKPIYITDTQYKILYDVDVGGSYNYRSLQPANRVVFRSLASSSSILVPGFISPIVALLSCLASSLTSGFDKCFCYARYAKAKGLKHFIWSC